MEDLRFKLVTPRLALREIVDSDAHDLFEMDSDAAVHRYIHNNPVTSVDQIFEVISMIRAQYEQYGIGRWAVIDRSTEECVGWCGLKYFRDCVNGHSDFYELGYRFKKKHWGKGFATEAARAVMIYAWQELGLSVVYAMTDVHNSASKNVLQKLGFVNECLADYGSERVDWHRCKKS